MATTNAGIDKGMDVLDVNGEKIGTVDDILDVQASSQTAASSTYASGAGDLGTADLGPAPYDPTNAGQASYLKINQGGILGIGAKTLYVPFSAVTNVVPGDNLTIKCIKDTCADMYGNAPEFLNQGT